MSMTIIQNKDGTYDITYHNLSLTDDFMSTYIRFIIYKLTYLYDLTYEEASSMIKSMNKRDFIRILNYNLIDAGLYSEKP